MFRTIRKKFFRLAVVSGAGAAATYFFDRDKGQERRAQIKEKANALTGRSSAGGSWQAQTERSANGFEPTVVPPAPAPAPPVSAVTAPAPPAASITDAAPGPVPAAPSAPVSGT